MGYRDGVTAKAERKRGFAAVKELEDDQKWTKEDILEYAKTHEKRFLWLDELPSGEFCREMKKMRASDMDEYRVFWWWRKAQEEASGNQEDDCGIGQSRYLQFMITQFIAPPFSEAWRDDRRTVLPDFKPLITEEAIEKGLSHKSIRKWAWIWHDRDWYTEEDEAADVTGRIHAGDLKFKHCHIVLYIPARATVGTVAKWFGVEPQYVQILKGRGAFMDCVEYLVHESPSAIRQNKVRYEDEDVHASPGFDFRAELTDLQINRARYGRKASEMTPADVMRLHVMNDGWTLKDCREKDPLTYSKIRNSLPPLRLDYLLDAAPSNFRMNIYVDGKGGMGKSSFCEYIAHAMFPNEKNPYFCIGNDEKVSFDGYDGEPVIIWDDFRASDFVQRFRPQGTYRILDPHPKKDAQQAKHSRIILTNSLNIICGVQPYEEFIEQLASSYIDRNGEYHDEEDSTQAWRRFPMILCVRENDFDILINKGFVENDMSCVQGMMHYAHVRGSMKKTMEKLDGIAKDKCLEMFGKPAQEAAKLIEERHDNKITDPDKIPKEFLDEFQVEYFDIDKQIAEERARMKAEAEEKASQKTRSEAEEKREILEKFSKFFWNSRDYGYGAQVRLTPSIRLSQERQEAFAKDIPAVILEAAVDNYCDGEKVVLYSKDDIIKSIEEYWEENIRR